VVIHALEVLAQAGPDVTLRVVCSKGTYIRTLCADIGKLLGVGGHLRALERTRVGPLTLDRALTVDEVHRRYREGELARYVRSLDDVLKSVPVLVVDAQAEDRVRHGASVSWSNVVSENAWTQLEAGMPVRIHDGSGRLLGMGRLPQSQVDRVAIEKVFVTDLV
jgi:tRNA pseudouridine55 synthase